MSSLGGGTRLGRDVLRLLGVAGILARRGADLLERGAGFFDGRRLPVRAVGHGLAARRHLIRGLGELSTCLDQRRRQLDKTCDDAMTQPPHQRDDGDEHHTAAEQLVHRAAAALGCVLGHSEDGILLDGAEIVPYRSLDGLIAWTRDFHEPIVRRAAVPLEHGVGHLTLGGDCAFVFGADRRAGRADLRRELGNLRTLRIDVAQSFLDRVGILQPHQPLHGVLDCVDTLEQGEAARELGDARGRRTGGLLVGRADHEETHQRPGRRHEREQRREDQQLPGNTRGRH